MKLFFYLLFFQYVTFNIYIHYVQMYHREKYAEAKINPAPAYPSVYSSTLNIRFPRRDGYPARLERRHSAFSLLNKGYRTPPEQPPLEGADLSFFCPGFCAMFSTGKEWEARIPEDGKRPCKNQRSGSIAPDRPCRNAVSKSCDGRTDRKQRAEKDAPEKRARNWSRNCGGNAVSEARAGKLGENAAEKRGGHFIRHNCAAEDSTPVTAFPQRNSWRMTPCSTPSPLLKFLQPLSSCCVMSSSSLSGKCAFWDFP